ncbi:MULTISPECIES: VTC domain-containing protein [unclassified Lentimicrobium]|uniref:VTC domain-containing protein n=1 Tax=unclassified Lentimicrobium TaxID=2677434 RepID=UPI001555144F|nr:MULTISPECIES: VTC domain-containing protein [unclassified Lentimicrobium]NPD44539.1 VTC domain-containing protein [Lentimicrobium sp. S6]NPD85644.1 VTC domain-containing protein [Lentimicrobium sp. L6]
MALSKEYTELKTSRFERKFVIERGGVPYVEKIVKMNPGAFRPAYYERQINNVYFDTENLRNYYDNHFGKSKRVKVRIRWYGDTFTKVESPILEFKLKTGAVGRKLSFKLNSFNFHRNITKQEIQKLFSSSDIPAWVVDELLYLTPTLLNTYKRKYYKSFNKHYRFTIDHTMAFYNFSSKNRGFLEMVKQKDITVLELKYDMQYDTTVGNVTKYLPFRLGKFSKYVFGIEVFNYHLAI